jgi:hypothetical protein
MNKKRFREFLSGSKLQSEESIVTLEEILPEVETKAVKPKGKKK